MCIGMLSEGSGLRRLLSVVVVLSMLSSEHIERLHSGQGVATMNGEDKRSSWITTWRDTARYPRL